MRLLVLAALLGTVFAGCAAPDAADAMSDDVAAPVSMLEPHVIVGIPDTGINPYHELYFREDRTEHPCTYIEDFPCDLPALNLSVGPNGMSWDERFEADRELWEDIGPGDAYWIPQTVFVGVVCESLYSPSNGDICILDDSHMHGTGTTSSVITENPDALIVFKEGGSSIEPILETGIPVDVFSVSWGTVVPIPVGGEILGRVYTPIYVLAAGNDPRSILLDSWAGSTRAITVGGAYTDGTQEPMAGQQGDVVSYFCRPTAQTRSIDGMRESYCGTSFATPTTAGAISKVILAIRENSGYTGTIVNDMVDPVADVSVEALKEGVFRTASYDPENQYDPDPFLAAVPVNPVAPWVQWGWGFVDGLVADATIDHFLVEEAPEKPMAAQLYMETIYTARETLHG